MIKTLLRKSKKILAIIQSRKIKNRMPSYRRNPTKTTIPRGYMWKRPPMKELMSLKLFLRKTNWNKVILKYLKMEPTKLLATKKKFGLKITNAVGSKPTPNNDSNVLIFS